MKERERIIYMLEHPEVFPRPLFKKLETKNLVEFDAVLPELLTDREGYDEELNEMLKRIDEEESLKRGTSRNFGKVGGIKSETTFLDARSASLSKY